MRIIIQRHNMALIFREAIKNQDFLDIIGTQSFTIDPTNMNPESRTYSTHHALVAQGAPNTMKDVLVARQA
ncbi:MAG: hypothetical protein ACLT1I_12645 [Mediterraneibacter faecis]